MNHVKKYPNHTFCWIDLQSTDTAQSKQFYGDLFGWTYEDQPLPQGGVYTMFKLDGYDVAGCNIMSPDLQGHPAFWSNYISADEMQTSLASAEEQGATIMVRDMEVLDAGLMSVMRGATGEFVSLWKAKNHIGAQLVNIPNTLIWNELLTHDVDASVAFYTKTFGWSVEKMDMGGFDYYVLNNGDRAAGGIMQAPDPKMETNWTVNFNIEDLDRALGVVKQHGGQLLMEPTDSPMGKIASVLDPQGAYFTLIQANQYDPMP